MATTTARSNPLSYLTDQLNELKAKGTHFRLRGLHKVRALAFLMAIAHNIFRWRTLLPACA